jgi:hypothetical protein
MGSVVGTGAVLTLAAVHSLLLADAVEKGVEEASEQ